VNLMQMLVETLLFYHPAVWWTSARIRHERELCCDDLAVASCGDAMCYARALTRLERLRLAAPGMAMAATGNPLLYRIQRIAGAGTHDYGLSKLPGVLALALGLVCFALNIHWAQGQTQKRTEAQAAETHEFVYVNFSRERGVQVDTGGPILHRTAVEYPRAAIEKGVQGIVQVEATLDATGNVSDARVLSGPPELRRAALQSVLQWHFVNDTAGSTRQISITFQVPPGGDERAAEERAKTTAEAGEFATGYTADHRTVNLVTEREARIHQLERQIEELQKRAAQEPQERAELEAKMAEGQAQLEDARRRLEASGALEERNARVQQLERQLEDLQERTTQETQGRAGLERMMAERQAQLDDAVRGLNRVLEEGAASLPGRTLKSINVMGLSDQLRETLLARLPVQVGDTLSQESIERLEAAVRQFDEHLEINLFRVESNQAEIRIVAPGAEPQTFEMRVEPRKVKK